MSFELEILVPDGTLLRNAGRQPAWPAMPAAGSALLPGHEPFLTLLAPCMLEYRERTAERATPPPTAACC